MDTEMRLTWPHNVCVIESRCLANWVTSLWKWWR